MIHGEKPIELTVKWSFNLDDNLIEAIKIDPIWMGITTLQECRNTTSKQTKPILKEYVHYVNKTICDDTPLNDSCKTESSYEEQRIEKTGEFIDYINKTICRDIGYSINKQILNYAKYDWKKWNISK